MNELPQVGDRYRTPLDQEAEVLYVGTSAIFVRFGDGYETSMSSTTSFRSWTKLPPSPLDETWGTIADRRFLSASDEYTARQWVAYARSTEQLARLGPDGILRLVHEDGTEETIS